MERLGRPNGRNDVCLTVPPADAEPRCEFRAEVGSLRIEAAEAGLHIRDLGLVLDVEKQPSLDRPGHDIRAAGELEVLERFVNSQREAAALEVRRLRLAHRRVNRVDGALGRRLAAPGVLDPELGFESEGIGQTDICLQRADNAGLSGLSSPEGDAGVTCNAAQGKVPPPALLVDRSTKGDRVSGKLPADPLFLEAR